MPGIASNWMKTFNKIFDEFFKPLKRDIKRYSEWLPFVDLSEEIIFKTLIVFLIFLINIFIVCFNYIYIWKNPFSYLSIVKQTFERERHLNPRVI